MATNGVAVGGLTMTDSQVIKIVLLNPVAGDSITIDLAVDTEGVDDTHVLFAPYNVDGTASDGIFSIAGEKNEVHADIQIASIKIAPNNIAIQIPLLTNGGGNGQNLLVTFNAYLWRVSDVKAIDLTYNCQISTTATATFGSSGKQALELNNATTFNW